jgi:hypothetical protein
MWRVLQSYLAVCRGIQTRLSIDDDYQSCK